mgnify:CR=1 FL=1
MITIAEKRMFSNKVIGTDSFLEMPDSSQNLYFHLSMSADDDGFVDKWKSIMRMTGKKEDDLKILIAKSFIIPFESGVLVIKDWRINNYLRSDRYNPTQYLNEKDKLYIAENNSYELKNIFGIPVVDTDKISIDKNNIYSLSATKEENEEQVQEVQSVMETKSNDNIPTFKAKKTEVIITDKVNKEVVGLSRDKTKEKEIEEVFDYWNSKQIIVHKTLTEETQKAILKMRKKYAVEEIKQMMDRYKQVLENGKYFFNYKWSLKDFLSQKNGAVDFAEDGSKWQDYCNKTGTAVNNHIQTQINNQKKVAEGVFKI